MPTQSAPVSPAACRALLSHCQDQIASTKPHPYYLQAYRQAEVSYWEHIPLWIASDAAPRRPGNCLDIGCAYGTLLRYVQETTACEAYAIDFIGDYLSPALTAEHRFQFAVNNIELDPFPWAVRFDVVLLTEVIEHFNFYPVPTLRKIRDLMSDDGTLYLSTPDASQWGTTTKYYRHLADIPPPAEALRPQIVDDHVWQYSEDELREVLDVAGLQICRFDYSPGVVHRHFNLSVQRK